MKFISSLLVCPLLGYALGLFLPWWSPALAGLAVGVAIPQKTGWSFLSTFLGTLVVFGMLIWMVSQGNDHILAKRISLLVTKQENPMALRGISAGIPALLAGVSALTGRLFVLMIRK